MLTQFILLGFVFVCNGEKRLLVSDAEYMANELKTLKATVAKLTSDQLTLRHSYDAMLLNLSSTVSKLTSHELSLKQDYETRLQNLSNTVSRLQSEVDTNSPHVGFYATLSAHHDLGQEQTIEFDTVLTNVGNSYNGVSGIFTVPIDGLYQFSTTSLSPIVDHIHTQMMLNTIAIGKNYGNNHGSSATINVLVSVKKGDIVYVRHMTGVNSQKIHGEGYSTFSGFLIK